MKKIAVLYNSPYLGGAERSITHQAKIAAKQNPKLDFTFIIPQVGDSTTDQIQKLIHTEFTDAKIIIFDYPVELFSVSRSGQNELPIFNIVIALLNALLELRRLHLHHYSVLWCNGNKIATIISLWAKLGHYKGRLIWHFRDYPNNKGKFRYLWRLFNRASRFQFTTVSNSHSVKKSVSAVLSAPSIEHVMIYNPAGDGLSVHQTNQIKTVGIVSMLAPWKGVHQILNWANLYHNKLEEQQISIHIYGGDIYKTQGAHQDYVQQLQELMKRYPNSRVHFKGNTPPEVIYKEIDLLIHPVVSPEPFGRIIVEAFQTRIPIISTALGGSGELVINGETGLTFPPYDYATLQRCVEKLIEDKEFKMQLIHQGSIKHQQIEDSVVVALKELFKD